MEMSKKNANFLGLVVLLIGLLFAADMLSTSSADAAEETFELPIEGATGYAVTELNLRNGDSGTAKIVGTVPEGTPFAILQDGATRFYVKTAGGQAGWISKSLALINLPDVIPSIVYKNTNGETSLFRSLKKEIPNVTGQQLYTSLYPNARLGREEYVVPVLYNTAKRLAAVQKAALANNDSIVVYEAYRPAAAQIRVRTNLDQLATVDKDVLQAISGAPWSKTWFISQGISNHQRGYALDVSLAHIAGCTRQAIAGYEVNMPTAYYEYGMPTAMHELSANAARYTSPSSATHTQAFAASEGALRLEQYFTVAGFTPLASEWWHFNDFAAKAESGNAGTGNWCVSAPLSYAP